MWVRARACPGYRWPSRDRICSVVLVEPLARRVDWLREVIADLGLAVEVERGRAEEPAVRRRWEGADVVTARAVAPLARLAGWCLPLLRPGGLMLAVKGDSAAAEVERDAAAVRAARRRSSRGSSGAAPGSSIRPSTVVVVERVRGSGRPGGPRRRRGQA